MVCSLFVHHMFPNSNCHLHAQVLSSHGGRLLLVHGWALEGVIPVLASGIAATRMASAPRGILITASSTKASKTPTSMVHNVRRAKSLLDLFEGFLKRMPLHMILPQLSPMRTRWNDPRKTLLCCHFFRLERAGTSDVHRIGLESFQHFQTPTNGSVINKHNVQMGLPEGHSVLLHFSQNGLLVKLSLYP